jgi:hypothetical protein
LYDRHRLLATAGFGMSGLRARCNDLLASTNRFVDRGSDPRNVGVRDLTAEDTAQALVADTDDPGDFPLCHACSDNLGFQFVAFHLAILAAAFRSFDLSAIVPRMYEHVNILT